MKQKVQVVVYMFRGLIHDVKCFSTEKKAEKYIRGWIKAADIDFPETIELLSPPGRAVSTKTTEGLLEWMDNHLSEQHDNEIHWFETEMK